MKRFGWILCACGFFATEVLATVEVVRPMVATGRISGDNNPSPILVESLEAAEVLLNADDNERHRNRRRRIEFRPERVTLRNGTASIELYDLDSNFSRRVRRGRQPLKIGGKLRAIPLGSPRGVYTGTFSIEYDGTSTPVSVRVSVESGIGITTRSHLQFGNVVTGEGSVVVPPSQTGTRAWFTVSGEPNRRYQLAIETPTVLLTRNGSGSGSGITVNAFTTIKPDNLDGTGNAEIYVGATRGAIPNTLPTGDYSGQLRVRVYY